MNERATVPLPAMSDAERDRVIRAIQFKIEKLRHGLGMPPDPEALAGYEALLDRVRADRRTQRIEALRAGLGSYAIPGKAWEGA